MNFRSLGMIGAALSIAACTVASEPELAPGTARSELRPGPSCGRATDDPCPRPLVCVDVPGDGCDPTIDKNCAGTCESVQPQTCGGVASFPCPDGLECVDDPSDDCDPKHGGSDCSGICVTPPTGEPCGGFLGIGCPAGQSCVDIPGDGCDPQHGGADCDGTCQ